MAKEEIILDFKVEQGEAIKELEQTKVAILNLKKEQADLNKAYKSGEKSTEDYAKELVRLEGELKKNNKAYNDNLKAVNGVKTKFDELVDSLGKSVPGFGAVQGGFGKVTTAAKAFIATPIGAVVTALGLALSALTAYFKGSEEGQNNFNKVVKIGTVVLGNILDIVRDLGGAVFKLFTLDFKGAADSLTEAFNGAKNIISETNEEIKKGLAIEDLRAQTDVLERQLIVLKGTNEARIADLKLKAEDKALGVEARQAALNEALRLQNELSDKSVEVAKNRLEIKKQENALSDSTKEDLREEAELTAQLALVEKDRADKSKEIVTKDQALEQESLNITNNLLRQRLELEQLLLSESQAKSAEEIESLRERIGLTSELTTKESEFAQSVADRNKKLDLGAEFADESAEANEDLRKSLVAQAKAEEFASMVSSARIGILSQLSNLTRVFGQDNKALAITSVIAQKAASISQIISNIGIANAKAIALSPVSFGQPFVAINTASGALSVTASLVEATKAINQITAAAGGGTFLTKGPQLMMVGDNPGGVERVDVTPISGRGKTVVGDGMIKLAGGGSVIANASSGNIDRSFLNSNMMKDMQFVVSWTEGNELGNKLSYKESLVTA